jgi:AcrR family transcriptional regulator
VRVDQILDAALVEFSACGYAAARMDDIAHRSGLSKGGIYLHFKAKDELFAALLTRSLTPQPLYEADLPAQLGPRTLAEWLVDKLYATVGDPGTVATLRLLIAEGDRIPELVGLWQKNVIQPHMDALTRIVQSQPWARASVLAREPWLVLSPVVHALITQMLPGTYAPGSLEDFRKGHVAMVSALLDGGTAV